MINNPVLRKELLLRMRSRQSLPVRIGIVLTILAIMALLYYGIVWVWLLKDPNPDSGRGAWMGMIGLQYLLICLIAPSVTANAITQEREQQTWEMLVFTRLLPSEIILGKLLARLVTILLLMVLFLPIVIFCWLHANHQGPTNSAYITPGCFAAAYLVMTISAIFFATFGLFMSWLLKRTLYAIMMAYTFVIGGLTIATFLITAALSQIFSDYNFVERCPLMWLNPVVLIYYAIAPNKPEDTLYMFFGLLCYVVLTLIMLWRMIAGFRRFAYEA